MLDFDVLDPMPYCGKGPASTEVPAQKNRSRVLRASLRIPSGSSMRVLGASLRMLSGSSMRAPCLHSVFFGRKGLRSIWQFDQSDGLGFRV